MGSLADYEAVKPGLDLLESWGVPHELLVASTHRTLERVVQWSEGAESRGVEVIIAAAGMAAHLPGIVAGQTNLPVIGVPIEAGALKGIDALYSIVQLPMGTPVACVGINGSVNAAVLALQILARLYPDWTPTLEEYRAGLTRRLDQQNAQLKLNRPGAIWTDWERAAAEKLNAPASIAPAASSAHAPITNDDDEEYEDDEEDLEDADQEDDSDEDESDDEQSRSEPAPPLRPNDAARDLLFRQAHPPLTGPPHSPKPHMSRIQNVDTSSRSGIPYVGRVKVDDEIPPVEVIEQAVDCLLAGGVIALPTETVYGLAVDATNVQAVNRLFALKERAPNKPIAIFLDSQKMLTSIARVVPAQSRNMLEAFWPGPLTVVFEKQERAFGHLSPGPTIGIRIPDHSTPLALVQELRRPLACTSANISGQSEARSADEIEAMFGRSVDMILDAGTLPEVSPSTVIDVTCVPFKILREGAISTEQLAAVLGDMINLEG